ncbi:tRNA (adenosine(37)-N6)-threonylcarbamoyltransferase complex dimerization subunit type 1 TsaB [Naumannella sp. ID2617S]|nr:tRNA (adenosine(37)-N6)-threonylcarbamoyltransferase complex dimerization subunit type 1 TsaB [Naumannella sp. ID2617S]
MTGHPDQGRVLAIDTSTDVRVGVAVDGTIVARRHVADTRQHVEQLTPLVAEALTEAGLRPDELDLVCVGLGPGPFTGLRVGIVAAQLLAGAHDVALHGVCSLDVLAAQAMRTPGFSAPQGFLAVTDARRKEVYWAGYAPDGIRREGPTVSAPDQLPALPAVGPGAALVGRQSPIDHVDVGLLAQLHRAIPDAGTEPLYLRRPDAAVATRRKSALPTSRPRLRRR